MNSADILKRLDPEWAGRCIECHGSLPSTNDRAAEILRESGTRADRAIVIAEEQTAGRGRHGREWSTAPRRSLALSIVFVPGADDPQVQLLPLAGALSVVGALESQSGLSAKIKWPNDILCGGKKISGVLAESRWCGDRLEGVVLGIGVNISQGREDFPPRIRDLATSIRMECGTAPDIASFTASLLTQLDALADLSMDDPARLMTQASKLWVHEVGDRIALKSGDREVEGRFNGIGEGGELMLEIGGNISQFLSGDVTRIIKGGVRSSGPCAGGRVNLA